MENDQAKVAVREEPAEPGTAGVIFLPVSELGILVAEFPAGKTLIGATARVSVVHEQSE
jgi:hypothetical protein